jgi:hypothetical protein
MFPVVPANHTAIAVWDFLEGVLKFILGQFSSGWAKVLLGAFRSLQRSDGPPGNFFLVADPPATDRDFAPRKLDWVFVTISLTN